MAWGGSGWQAPAPTAAARWQSGCLRMPPPPARLRLPPAAVRATVRCPCCRPPQPAPPAASAAAAGSPAVCGGTAHATDVPTTLAHHQLPLVPAVEAAAGGLTLPRCRRRWVPRHPNLEQRMWPRRRQCRLAAVCQHVAAARQRDGGAGMGPLVPPARQSAVAKKQRLLRTPGTLRPPRAPASTHPTGGPPARNLAPRHAGRAPRQQAVPAATARRAVPPAAPRTPATCGTGSRQVPPAWWLPQCRR